MIIKDTNISMIRGDTESITIGCTDTNQIAVPFVVGDTIYLTIKLDINTEVKVLQKVVTTFTDGKAIVEIEPADTHELKYGVYRYDVQLTKADGTVITLVPPSRFIIEGEVTYE